MYINIYIPAFTTKPAHCMFVSDYKQLAIDRSGAYSLFGSGSLQNLHFTADYIINSVCLLINLLTISNQFMSIQIQEFTCMHVS